MHLGDQYNMGLTSLRSQNLKNLQNMEETRINTSVNSCKPTHSCKREFVVMVTRNV